MKSSHEMLKWVVNVIRNVLHRPGMYDATTAGELEVHLWCYIGVWGVLMDRTDALFAIEDEICIELGIHSLKLARYFIDSHPTASDNDAREFVLRQYDIIANRLGVFGTEDSAEEGQ